MCTLVICKVKVRRAAQVGDWIAGTGFRSLASHENAAYLEPFVDWLTGLSFQPNRLYGKPQKGPLSRSVIGLDLRRK